MNIPTSDFSAPAYAKRGALVSALCLSTFLLASCGGGSGTDTAKPGADSVDGRKEALAVSGTWTGRAPKYEVINGITIPPEPAPTLNNSTLAGVDINNNGVRDDVERKIANETPTQSKDAFVIASIIQKTTTGVSVSAEERKSTFCLAARIRYPDGMLLTAQLNTRERMNAYYANLGIFATPDC